MVHPDAELYVVVITIEQQYHNYCADILDCNFHINVLYAKPTISPPKMNSGFPMEKLSVVGGGVGQLHH